MICARDPHCRDHALAPEGREAAATDGVPPAIIASAALYAQTAFLLIATLPDHLSPQVAAEQANCIVIDVIADMQQDTDRVVQSLHATADQCHSLIMGQSALFDLCLSQLQATVPLGMGHA